MVASRETVWWADWRSVSRLMMLPRLVLWFEAGRLLLDTSTRIRFLL
ncbi:MAG: hypothetical protein OXM88_16105 [bacterium]|nr:hypothetical protein [bacterium]